VTTTVALDSGLPDGLVDGRTGIVRRLEQPPLPPGFPVAFRLVSAVLSDSTVFSPWPSDPVTAGCALGDLQPARDAAVGEAVERYCGNIVRDGLVKSSYAALVAAGERAVDPTGLALYSPAQYAEPGFPYVAFDRDLEVRWTPGRTLGTSAPAWVPASLVWVTYTETGLLPGEPRTNGTVFAGIAAGPSRAAAEWSALLEVVERDTLVRAWSGGVPFVEVPAPAWVRELTDPCPYLRFRHYEVVSDVGLGVRVAVVRDEDRAYLTLGSACRPDPAAAAAKAVVEALQLQLLVRQLDDESSAYAAMAARGDGPLKPWRADRRYTESYRPDLRDARDPICNLQLYLDPALQRRFEDALRERANRVTPGARRVAGAPRSLRETVERLGAPGHDGYSVEVTTSDLRDTGLHVARVVVPGFVSNGPPAYPFSAAGLLLERAGAPPAAHDLPLPH
jgi:ribosomal protein S12 methylthiotransferase accessory factor